MNKNEKRKRKKRNTEGCRLKGLDLILGCLLWHLNLYTWSFILYYNVNKISQKYALEPDNIFLNTAFCPPPFFPPCPFLCYIRATLTLLMWHTVGLEYRRCQDYDTYYNEYSTISTCKKISDTLSSLFPGSELQDGS